MSATQLNLEGFYIYTAAGVNDRRKTKIVATVNEADHTITGSGTDGDNGNKFTIAGVLVGDEFRFVKTIGQLDNSPSSSYIKFEYIGKRLEPKGNVYQFSGGWGQGSGQFGYWVLSGVGTALPTHPIVGNWQGSYSYNSNDAGQTTYTDGPMTATISLDNSVPYVADGPYAISGTASDAPGNSSLKGTVTKAGDLDFIKAYPSRSWRYQGKYEASGTISGTWGEVGGNTPAQGTFRLTQTPVIPTPTATSQPVLPQGVLYSASADAGTLAAIDALNAKNTFPINYFWNLRSGFNTQTNIILNF